MTDAIQTVVSAAEYARMAETNTPTELIEGVIVVTPAPTPEHQQRSASLYRALYPLIPNGRLYFAPIDVYFDESTVVQPDLVWVSEGGHCTVGAKWLQGPPDLIVEMVLPGSAKRDRGHKFDLYQRFGVREYWIVDLVAETIEVYTWREGVYQRHGVYAPGDTFEPPVLVGGAVDVSAIFAP